MDYDIQKFISRLETMQKNGDAWLTINAVLSLLEDCKEPVFHLRSYGDVSKSDLESYVNDSIQALGAGIGLTPEEFAEAAKDLGWAPAPAEGDDLPPLPEADFTGDRVIEASLYSADQMRAYALAARTNPQPKGMEPYGWVHELWVDGEMAGFGRTMSRLPEVFGVSRTTLYNWLKGDAPKAMYEQRIEQLARAARAFDELGFKPTATMLDRTVAGGKSFLQLMSEGADGRETAKRMVRIAQRGAESRSKLDALLAGQKPTALSADDFGTPSLKEDV